MSPEMSPLAEAIYLQKYAHTKPDGTQETWAETAHRVATNVMAAVNAPAELVAGVERIIRERKFMPGGRYLYAAGRELHQCQNCALFRAEDSREGWADLLHKATMSLMTGAGIGVVYSDIRPEGAPVQKTGGVATGPIALMQMVNEAGRGIMQGGSRRSAIWAGLHWNHPDCPRFIGLKNWSPEVRELKEKDFNFPATMDGTNISVILDDEFFAAYQSSTHPLHKTAQDVYWSTTKQMLKTAEPGFSVDIGVNNGENLRNAPVCADTHVLTDSGYRRVGNIVDHPVTVWTGKQWAPNVVFKKTAENAPVVRVSMTGGRVIRCEPNHEFLVERYEGAGTRRRLVAVDRVPAKDLSTGDVLHVSAPTPEVTKEIQRTEYTLGFLYGDGYFTGGERAEVSLCTPEKERCLASFDESLISSVTSPDSRGYTRVYLKGFYGVDKTVPPRELLPFEPTTWASFVAGLFDADGNYDAPQKRIRLSANDADFLREVARILEQLGILANVSKNGSSTYGQKQTHQLVVMGDWVKRFAEIIPCQRLSFPGARGYEPYRASTIKVLEVTEDQNEDVYCADVKVPEHSFMAEGVIISNCCEISSRDDSDICNLGSVNMARVTSLADMEETVRYAVAFLLAGTVYSHVPTEKIAEVREKNRRLGLGLMGLHEWLLQRGKPYGRCSELESYLKVYESSTSTAHQYADAWGLSRPVKTRAIAPTGTIGIVAETTTGIEPVFCVAYKRRYIKDGLTHYQYVVDPTAKRLIDAGVRAESIEDAYSLAQDVERRVEFQAWVQKYVDHAISSTINLPAWGSEFNNPDRVREFGEMLMRHLPGLRGLTAYPDGCRGGQPLSRVSYAEAIAHVGEVFIEQVDVCDLSKSGSCGS